jgi:hypothetical protein
VVWRPVVTVVIPDAGAAVDWVVDVCAGAAGLIADDVDCMAVVPAVTTADWVIVVPAAGTPVEDWVMGMVARVVAPACDTDEPCEREAESCSMYAVAVAVTVWFWVTAAAVLLGMAGEVAAVVFAAVVFAAAGTGVPVTTVVAGTVVPGDDGTLWFTGVDWVVVHPAQSSAAIRTSPMPAMSFL